MENDNEAVDTEENTEETDAEETFNVADGIYLKAEAYDTGKAYANRNKHIYDVGSKESFNPLTGVYERSVEKKLDTKDRKRMTKTEFGIPDLKKYPLNDANHVKSAISYFSKCPVKYKHSLALKIIKAANKFGIKISKDSNVYKEAHKYIKKSKSKESLLNYSMESYIDKLIK